MTEQRKMKAWQVVEITGIELMNGELYRVNSQNNDGEGYCKSITPFEERGQMAYVIWFSIENDFSDDVIVPGHAASRIFYNLEGK